MMAPRRESNSNCSPTTSLMSLQRPISGEEYSAEESSSDQYSHSNTFGGDTPSAGLAAVPPLPPDNTIPIHLRGHLMTMNNTTGMETTIVGGGEEEEALDQTTNDELTRRSTAMETEAGREAAERPIATTDTAQNLADVEVVSSTCADNNHHHEEVVETYLSPMSPPSLDDLASEGLLMTSSSRDDGTTTNRPPLTGWTEEANNGDDGDDMNTIVRPAAATVFTNTCHQRSLSAPPAPPTIEDLVDEGLFLLPENHVAGTASSAGEEDQQQHPGNYTTEDDDDDLAAVMALVAAGGSSENAPSYGRRQSSSVSSGDHNNAITTPGSSFIGETTTLEESKEEIGDSTVEALPSSYAATILAPTTTEEAMVLETADAPSQQLDEDARIAAAVAEEEELLLALKLSAYECGGSSGNNNRVPVQQQQFSQEATVVEITDGPSASFRHRATSTDSVRAEWIGQDFSTTPTSTAPAAQQQQQHASAPVAASAVSEESDTTQEATVIDSAPLEKDFEGIPEEAQVLMEHNETENDLDRKPAAVDLGRSNSRRSQRPVREAEVLTIQERADIHPAEREEEDARASLVDIDYSYTVAIPSRDQGASEHATVTSGSDGFVASRSGARPATEVQAVLDEGNNNRAPTTAVAAEVQETDSPDQNADHVAPVEQAHAFLEHPAGQEPLTDRKPAAVGGHRPGSRQSSFIRTGLSVIAEQEGEVLSFQEELDIHPTLREEQRLSESEAELIGPDSSCTVALETQERASTNTQESSRTVVPMPNGEYTAPHATAVVAQSFESSPCGTTEGTTVDSASEASDALTASVVNPHDQPTQNTFSDPSLTSSGNDCSAAAAAAAAALSPSETSGGSETQVSSSMAGEAEVLAIQHVQDIHPLEHAVDGLASAELVGTTNDLSNDIAASASNSAPPNSSLERAHAILVDRDISFASPSIEKAVSSSRDHNSSTGDDSAEVVSALDATTREDGYAAALSALDDATREESYAAALSALDDQVASQNQSESRAQSNSAGGQNGHQQNSEDPYSTEWLRLPEESPSASAPNQSIHGSPPLRGGLHAVTAANIQTLSASISRGTSNVMDALFGKIGAPSDDKTVHSISSRELLPWSVIKSPSGSTWIATMQTNQRALDRNNTVEASKSLRAFSMPSEHQAICLAKAWTPPRMLPFAKHKHCHICNAKFAVFRRACHCRNCGVCVCKDCAVQWPAKMIPDTYNTKKEFSVNACKSCNWLCSSFRLALLEGNRDQAVALHATGNINLHTPFGNVKGELLYPTHAAVLGGCLELLKFLVDDNCCPIRSVRIAGSSPRDAAKHTPIVTSKGRSLLGIALENEDLEIVRYLVVEKGVSVATERDVTPALLCRNFEKLLTVIPSGSLTGGGRISRPSSVDDLPPMGGDFEGVRPMTPEQMPLNERFEAGGRTLSEEARNFGAVKANSTKHADTVHDDDDNDDNQDSSNEECIICFDGTIDCVATPCGHQMCCLRCSENLSSRCPVCSSECSFMRVYKL